MITPVQEVQKSYVNIYWKISVLLTNKKNSAPKTYIYYLQKNWEWERNDKEGEDMYIL